MTTTAAIRAKGLDSTGVTEELANKMWGNVGGHYLAIVDLKVAFHGEDDDGNRKVALVIDQIEPVVDGNLSGALVTHVRDIHAALHRNRMLAENGPQLPRDGQPTAPSTAEVLEQGRGVVGRDDEGPVLVDAEDDPDEAEAEAESARAREQIEIDGENAKYSDEPEAAEDPWDYPAPEGTDVSSLPTVDDPFLKTPS